MKSKFEFNSGAFIWLMFAVGAVIMAISGCDSNAKSGFATDEDAKEEVVYAPEPLKLLAVGVPAFGEEISRQWSAQRDGDLEISHLSLDKFDGGVAVPDDVDLIVHPSSISVDLISRRLIRVYPKDALVDSKMNRKAFFTHFRKGLVRYDDTTWSVCLGGQQLRLFYRKDVLESLGIDAPTTWKELNWAVKTVAESETYDELVPIVIPTSAEMAGNVLMARVASSIRAQGKLTSFFERKTMKPTIVSQPFEQALEDIRKFAAFTGGSYSNEEAFSAFTSGKCAFSIAWPSQQDGGSDQSIETRSGNWGAIRMPGSEQVYDFGESLWRNRRSGDEFKVDLLGMNAINVSIAAKTANAKDVIEFVMWLTSKQNSQKLLREVAAPFQATHLARIGQWYGIEQADRKFLDALADAVIETHEARVCLMFPQIPGKRNYLKILDEQVRKFVNDESVTARETLENVAQQWEQLTESLERKSQVKTLRRGSGV